MNEVKNTFSFYQHIKTDLLCYGARISKEAEKFVFNINPYLINKGIHNASFCINGDTYINMQINEKYCEASPYIIHYDANKLYLLKNDNRICEIKVTVAPTWYEKRTTNGTYMRDVFNVHGRNTLAFSKYSDCEYVTRGLKCKFCSISVNTLQHDNIDTRINDILETLESAFEYNPDYSIALSEGTKAGRDRGALFFAKIAKSIVDKFGIKHISAELAPPEEMKYIDSMIENGITSIIMNIELYDNNLRQAICPGKSEISFEHYIECLSYAVKLVGVGNVSSVLIAGIEPISNTIECAKILLGKGIVPIVIPFKPYDNCEFSSKPVTNPRILEEIHDAIEKESFRIGFPRTLPHSCIACGACNLQNKYIEGRME